MYSTEVSVGVRLTGNIHTTYRFKLAVLNRTHKSTSTHKVQESASRTAIGAVPSIGLIFGQCVLYHIHVSHLHSKVQSSPVHPKPNWDCPFPSASSAYMRRAVSFFPHRFQQPACTSAVSSPSSCLSETQTSFAWSRDDSWSADILLTSLRIQKKEAHFASQEVDMDLKQICCGGNTPCPLEPRRTCWWGIFLKDTGNISLLIYLGKCIFFDIISNLLHYSCYISPCRKAVEAGPQTFLLVNKFYGHLTNKVKTADIHTNLA